MDNRKEIVENILSELNGRRGFDDWWCNIDEDIKEEITETLVNLLPIQGVGNSNRLREERGQKVIYLKQSLIKYVLNMIYQVGLLMQLKIKRKNITQHSLNVC